MKVDKTIRTNNYVYTIKVDDSDNIATAEIDAAIKDGKYFIASNHKMIAFPTMACVYPYISAEIDYFAEWINMIRQDFPATMQGMLEFCARHVLGFNELTPMQGGAIAGSFLTPFEEIGDNGPTVKWTWNKIQLGTLWNAYDDVRKVKAFIRETLLNMDCTVY